MFWQTPEIAVNACYFKGGGASLMSAPKSMCRGARHDDKARL